MMPSQLFTMCCSLARHRALPLLSAAFAVSGSAAAQGVTVTPLVSSEVEPGQVVTIAVQAEAQPAALIEAVGGFALDFEITQGAEFVDAISLPSFPLLNDTTRVTAVTQTGVSGIVAGQFADISGSNPGLVTLNPVDLFTVDITISASAPIGAVLEFTAGNPDTAGGVFLYPQNSSSTVLAVPNAPASSLVFASASTVIDTICLADVNGNGMTDPGDFTAWIVAYNTQSPECDQNNDGLCTPGDFTAWVTNYNIGC